MTETVIIDAHGLRWEYDHHIGCYFAVYTKMINGSEYALEIALPVETMKHINEQHIRKMIDREIEASMRPFMPQ